jgi:hypothetical protein
MTSGRRLRVRRRGNAACSQRTPGLPRCVYATIALALPFQAPGLTVSGLSFYGPDSELQLDIRAINIRLIYESSRRGVWTIFGFPYAQGVDCVLPVKGAVMSVGRRRNPQHFSAQPQARCRFYTSHPQVCAQKAGKRSCPADSRQRFSWSSPPRVTHITTTITITGHRIGDELCHSPGRAHRDRATPADDTVVLWTLPPRGPSARPESDQGATGRPRRRRPPRPNSAAAGSLGCMWPDVTMAW